ncbi:MAG: DUF2238 domain-containing protein [Nitrospira sp.]|jgi:putative membrane protein|nr:DUF2238 domain-containing protein [Nitrospira sp.]
MGDGATDRSEAGQAPGRLIHGLLLAYGIVWIWLAVDPVNRRDWLLENLLPLAGFTLLLVTYRRFQFSRLSYCLIAFFLTLHAIGAHYTYAEVPFGYWLKDVLALSRNPFDRLVHFAFGLLLAYPVREWLVRLAKVEGAWSYYLPMSAILAQSSLFEIIEAVVAVLVSPELGNLYLGTQGDEWDAQKDMAAALVGAFFAMAVTFVAARFSSAGAMAGSR